jgi:hypothetical protein
LFTICNCPGAACCVDGRWFERGEETKILEEIYLSKTILRKQGIALSKLGTWVLETDGDLETPLIDNKDCA